MKRYFVDILSTLVLSILILIPGTVQAVKEFKVSHFNNASQIWFEAEAFDERIPEGDRYFRVTGEGNAPKTPDGASGQAVTRAGGAGGTIIWRFDISRTEGKSGVWYFWGRIKNPSNQSDYMLVLGDRDDDIPDGPPFPGGDMVKPFDNPDDRIFEQDVPIWGWWGGQEGSTKDLQPGENSMYIFHRQGDSSVFWDVFVWTDSRNYVPSMEDYRNADPMEAGKIAVQPLEKLSTTWGSIKNRVRPE